MRKDLLVVLGIVIIIAIGVSLFGNSVINWYIGTPVVVTQAPVSKTNTYTIPSYGFSITYPKTVIATSTVEITYLLPTNWSVVETDVRGSVAQRFMLPKSDEILTAEIRIGASDIGSNVSECLASKPNFTSSTETINGKEYTVLSGSDAGLGHYASTKSYRTVVNDTCFAIEELVYGVRGENYDPPRQASYTMQDAESQLQSIVDTMKFSPTLQ